MADIRETSELTSLITGRIRCRTPIFGTIEVTAEDQDLRLREPLGSVIADADGSFEIRYPRDAGRRSERGKVDIVVTAYIAGRAGQEGKVEIARSEVFWNAPDHLRLDLAATVPTQATEYERLMEALPILLEGQSVRLVDIEETDDHQDASFLARESGEALEAVEAFVLAQRMSTLHAVPPWADYALLREGLLVGFDPARPASFRLLATLATSADVLVKDVAALDIDVAKAAINRAIAARLVPAVIESQLTDVLDLLARDRAEALKWHRQTAAERIAEVMDLMFNAKALKTLGARLVKEQPGSPAAVAAIIDSVLDQSGAGLHGQVGIAALAGFDAKAISRVRSKLGLDTQDVAVERRLARASAHEVAKAAIARATPSLVASVANSKASLDARHPTAVLAGHLERDTQSALPLRSDVVAFLDANPDFDVRHSHIGAFIKPPAQTKRRSKAASKRKELAGSLRTLQRLVRLSPRYDHVKMLGELGVTSARDVVAQGEARFVESATRSGTTDAVDARAIFRRARAMRDGATMFMGQIRALNDLHNMPMTALAHHGGGPQTAQLAEKFPDIAALFGATGACTCTECRSVWGPAAYLVDALDFLKARKVKSAPTPLQPNGATGDAWAALVARRPDLLDIDLDCANAETAFPYIDLVCEVLEGAVAPDTGMLVNLPIPGPVAVADADKYKSPTHPVTLKATIHGPRGKGPDQFYVLRDPASVWKVTKDGAAWRARELHQTLDTGAALKAEPRYVNALAYDKLKQANAAFLLPFDRALTATRAWLGALGVPRAQLIRLFGPAAARDMVIAADRLGLNEHEADLITGIATALPQETWSTPLASLPDLQIVENILGKTGLELADLEAVLATAFVGRGKLSVKRPGPNDAASSCDTKAMTVPGLEGAALERMHLFLRLRKRTGWAIGVLDAAIMAPRLCNGKLDANALIALGGLAALNQRTGVPVEELATLYGGIATFGPTSLFAQTFRQAPRDPLLALPALIANQALPANDPARKKASAAQGAIAAAIGIKQTTADLLIKAGVARTGNDILSVAMLAEVLAPATLAKICALTPEDVLTLADRSELKPFDSPATTASFLDLAEKLRAFRLTPNDLEHFLAFAAPDSANRGLADDAATRLLAHLAQAGCKAVRDSYVTSAAALAGVEGNEALIKTISDIGKVSPLAGALASGIIDVYNGAAVVNGKPLADFIDHDLAPVLAGDAVDSRLIATALIHDAAPIAGSAGAARAALQRGWLYALYAARGVAVARYAAARDALVTTLKISGDLADAILSEAKLHFPSPAAPKALSLLLSDPTLVEGSDDTPSPADTSKAQFADNRAALRLAAAIGRLAQALTLDGPELAWLLRRGGDLGWTKLDQFPTAPQQNPLLPFAPFEKLLSGISLGRRFGPSVVPEQGPGLADIFEEILTAAPPVTPFKLIAEWCGTDQATLEAIDAALVPRPGPGDYFDPAVLATLIDAAALLRRTSLSVADAVALAAPAMNDAAADIARDALRRATDPTKWTDVASAAQTPVRSAKRDALVAWLIANRPEFPDSSALYEYFLIDVEMMPCGTTSRIVSAHSSVQQFVTRCLMGLEQDAIADLPSDGDWSQWSWMKNYRVWQAQRQVFVFPENWIDPELRLDASELFEKAQDALQQGDLGDTATENAAEDYLAGLDTIGHLEVVACHEFVAKREMHVLARTRGGDPTVYYHRTFVAEARWTPWTRVPLDIASDQIALFTRNGRLFAGWLVLGEETDEEQGARAPAWPPAQNTKAERPQKSFKVQVAISQMDRTTWLTPRLSRRALRTGWYDILPRRDGFRLWALGFGDTAELIAGGWRKAIERTLAADTEQLAISFLDDGVRPGLLTRNNGKERTLGGFSLSGCEGVPEPTHGAKMPASFLPKFPNTAFLDQRFCEFGLETSPFGTVNPANDLAIVSPLSFGTHSAILADTPDVWWQPGTHYKIAYPLQATLIDTLIYYVSSVNNREREREMPLVLGTLLPFFYDDGARAYTVVPEFRSTDPRNARCKTFSSVIGVTEQIIERLLYYIDAFMAAGNDPGKIAAIGAAFQADKLVKAIREELLTYRGLTPGYRFELFHHPLVCAFRKILSADGIDGLISRKTQTPDLKVAFNFDTYYQPTQQVDRAFPVDDVDFSDLGAYASYNWELFFHLPYLIATRLAGRGRFSEARQWLHRIFEPTGAHTAPDGTLQLAPQRWWVTRPFSELDRPAVEAQDIRAILDALVADPSGAATEATRAAIKEWREKPFQPHVIARTRPVAYMRAVIMSYVGLLIDWGDSEFRKYTTESVNEARNYYDLANKLLGPKPRVIAPAADLPPRSFAELVDAQLDAFGDALAALENYVPPPGDENDEALPDPLPATGPSLRSQYFCVPPNNVALDYWDRVADRLFKIRHCRNIDGIEVPLALFAPPIDPGALVRATAAGLDIATVVAGFGAPLPYYRFNILSQKASELAQEARTLSNALLAAIEKHDAEGLGRLREAHETALLEAVLMVRSLQKDEAEQQIVALDKQRETIDARVDYYRSREYMNAGEAAALALNIAATVPSAAAEGMQIAAAIISLAPTFSIGVAGFGGSPAATAQWGSQNLTAALGAGASAASAAAGLLNAGAALAGTMAGYDRRKDEWDFQRSVAELERKALAEQRAAAAIRRDMAARDITNQKLQISNAKIINAYQKDKFTNVQLYEWMVGRLTGLSNFGLGLALDMARKAQRCFEHELALPANFIGAGYWSDARMGLGSADALIQDIKRMESAYLDGNVRDGEISIEISVADLDPEAIIELRRTGKCYVTIPESRYDAEHSGYYMRRLKAVELSVPVVTGSQGAIGTRLTLVSNRYRRNMNMLAPGDGYAEQKPTDPRFVYDPVGKRSITTSRPVADSGMFENNLRDERYLPFEGAGAISVWQIELTGPFPSYDRATITDVRFHIRYTARDGGSAFADATRNSLIDRINEMQININANRDGLWIAIDLRQTDATLWDKLVVDGSASFVLDAGRFPLFSRDRSIKLDKICWLVQTDKKGANPPSWSLDGIAIGLNEAANLVSTLPGETSRPIYTSNPIGPPNLDVPFTIATANGASLESVILLVKFVIA